MVKLGSKPPLALAASAIFLAGVALPPGSAAAPTLTGSFTPIPVGSNVNLTAIGTLDWVHWGLQADNGSSLDRKAGVAPQISDFTLVYDPRTSYGAAWQYGDNWNGYGWSDGFQTPGATNTTTGVYVIASAKLREAQGFQFTVPAGTEEKILHVFVGAFATAGQFQASLSDNSRPAYSDTTLDNSSGNGPSGIYTIQFAAGSASQTLNIKWTTFTPLVVTNSLDPSRNVTLQAAALDLPGGANNPPYAALTSPANNAGFEAPAVIPLSADAFDVDGAVAKVEFFQGTNKLGEATASPYTFTWNVAPVGHYLLTARVTDDAGASRVSSPVEIFVNTTGGSLSGSYGPPPSAVDLTAEGTADWIHWGLTNSASCDRKTGVAPQISTFTKVGTNLVQRLTDYASAFSWNDGTPISAVNSTGTGVSLGGITNGFRLTVPADPIARTLKLYVGLYGAGGDLRAWLSDGSAPAYTDTSLHDDWRTINRVYTLVYASAAAGQTLTLEFTAQSLFDMDYGEVSLAAATLQGGPAMPLEIRLLNPSRDAENFSFSFTTEANRAYTVEFTPTLAPVNWQTLTNITGTGSPVLVTDPVTNNVQRFYRVQTP